VSLNGAGLLPPNATAYERAQAEVSSRLLAVDTQAIRRERDPLACDAAFVPYLGWERSVHHWTGIDAVDRASTATSFQDHLSYGAPAALEKEISLDVGAGVTVQDFFEAGLAWPNFLIVMPAVDDGAPPDAGLVWRSAISRKNVRDYPVLRYVAQEAGSLVVGAFMRVAATIRVEPLDPTAYVAGPDYVGAALRVIATIKLEPFA
jgi:phage tail P2-like protein